MTEAIVQGGEQPAAWRRAREATVYDRHGMALLLNGERGLKPVHHVPVASWLDGIKNGMQLHREMHERSAWGVVASHRGRIAAMAIMAPSLGDPMPNTDCETEVVSAWVVDAEAAQAGADAPLLEGVVKHASEHARRLMLWRAVPSDHELLRSYGFYSADVVAFHPLQGRLEQYCREL